MTATATATPTKKKKAPKAAKSTRKSLLSAHEQEFAEKVIGPKLHALIAKSNYAATLADLTKAYNKEYATKVSATTLKKWLKLLGWTYERRPVWTGMPGEGDEQAAHDKLLLDDDTKPNNVAFGKPASPAAAAQQVGPRGGSSEHGVMGA